MNNLVETETSLAVVTVVGIVTQPPAVTLVHSGRDAGGVKRDFVQQVPVRDACLAHRVLSELHKGDSIQVTVVNEWHENGCETYLADFKKATDAHQNAAAENGVADLVRDDITQVVIQPISIRKTKVQK